jgi:hypothetical protein
MSDEIGNPVPGWNIVCCGSCRRELRRNQLSDGSTAVQWETCVRCRRELLNYWTGGARLPPTPHRSIAAEWGSDADLDEAIRAACRKLGRGECPLAGSAWCEWECPFREGDW